MKSIKTRACSKTPEILKRSRERQRILIAEDDKNLQRLLGLIFLEDELKIDFALDGQVAWQKVLRRPYALLIVDLQMPKLDGLSLIRQMKQQNIRLPVVILTAMPEALVGVDLVELGVRAVFTKQQVVPFVFRREVLAIIERK